MYDTNKILDTLRLDDEGFYLKPFHIDRTVEALFAIIGQPTHYGQHAISKKIRYIYDEIEKILLQKKTSPLARVRIVLNPSDLSYEISHDPISLTDAPIKLQLASELKNPLYSTSGKGLHNYKWEDRSFWENLTKQKDEHADDVLACNTKDHVTETTRFNIFFYDPKSDQVLTPPLETGCINGVFRRYVFHCGEIQLPQKGLKKLAEHVVHRNELPNYDLYVANSVRGVLPARLV